MMDLFSSFNPITSINTSMNWMSLLLPTTLMINMMWSPMSPSLQTNKLLSKYINKQFKPSINKLMGPNIIIVTTIMVLIFFVNIMGLMPEVFSTSSNLIPNISMALTMWMALTLMKLKNLKKFLSHLTPSNTPNTLIPFMVIIELVSLMIQPITLSIRLTANITAGHIMIILISQLYSLSPSTALTMNLMMLMLELGVAMIQAYVFSTLIIMYSK